MTPEQLVGIAELLIELRVWIEENYPGNLDAQLVDACVDVCVRHRHELLKEGAK